MSHECICDVDPSCCSDEEKAKRKGDTGLQKELEITDPGYWETLLTPVYPILAVFNDVSGSICASLQTTSRMVQALGKTREEAIMRAWSLLEAPLPG